MVRFGEPSSYIQHIALEKEQTSPVLCSLHRSRVPRRQRTQSSPNDNTAKVSTKHKTNGKKNATSGLGLTSNRAWILETTLNVKKATRRRRRLPPAGGPKSVSLFRWCIKRDIVVLTPLNYIQTFKIQIFFFPQECRTCIFTQFTHIERSPWTESDTADLARSEIQTRDSVEYEYHRKAKKITNCLKKKKKKRDFFS